MSFKISLFMQTHLLKTNFGIILFIQFYMQYILTENINISQSHHNLFNLSLSVNSQTIFTLSSLYKINIIEPKYMLISLTNHTCPCSRLTFLPWEGIVEL
jgi:hypothetical protein